MIHAYLFLTQKIRDRDGHGADFQHHMNRINEGIRIFQEFSFKKIQKLQKNF